MTMCTQVRDLCKEIRDVKMEGLAIDAIMKYHIEQENWSDAMTTAREAIEVYRRGGDKQGEAMALHSSACLELDRFFADIDSNIVEFKKMGCLAKFWKGVDKAKYDELVQMLSKSVDLFKQ